MMLRQSYASAGAEDVTLVAPKLVEAGVIAGAEELAARILESPWLLQVRTLRPQATFGLLDSWRRGTQMAAIRHVVARSGERRRFLRHLLNILHEQGFRLALSPLLARDAQRPFRRVGFVERERLVVLRKSDPDFRPVKAACDVRRLEPQDAEALATLDRVCFDDVWHLPAADILAMLPGVAGFVAVQDGQLIGYNMVSTSREAGTVGRLAVRPDHRDRGVGSTLLAAGLTWLRDGGGTDTTLCTQQGNMASRRLYRRFGFEQLPEELSLMQKDL